MFSAATMPNNDVYNNIVDDITSALGGPPKTATIH
jgi:hypothetical protein